jgi:HNH endonuclease
MRCIFCRSDSSSSRSEEHIIPYSLGNRSHTLRPGIVCDTCNNYFSREVERPFLEAPAIQRLRFHQVLENRRGRVPPIPGLIFPDVPVTVWRDFKTGGTSVDVPVNAYERIAGMSEGKLFLPMSGVAPTGPVISRFLAKVAVEAMAQRISDFPEGLDYLCDEVQLNPIRDHARRGRQLAWPIHSRRIYDADSRIKVAGDDLGQTLHEYDFLVTEASEWYLVLAIFGLELTINLGGPDIDGYIKWLANNDDLSPLYAGKNATYAMPRIPSSADEGK